MARLTLKDIEARVTPLGEQGVYDREFLFDLLIAYGKPKSSITRLRKPQNEGSLNVAADETCEVALKNVVYLRELPAGATEQDLLNASEALHTAPHVLRYTPRFIMVTDYVNLLAWDTKTGENIIFPLSEIGERFTFFLPWAGMEKTQYVAEAHADVKAAERMGELFNELDKANPSIMKDETQRHGLNVFFTRLLFCFFAEDTGIFQPDQFTNAVGSHTLEDGSDTQDFLTSLFAALDAERPEDKPAHLAGFPYVNGRLFSMDQTLTVPVFTRKARNLLIGLGTLMWQEINPDIFGSMFQAIVTPGQRSDLGQHYTSVPNILKTLEPLFLDDLRAQFDEAYDNPRKLEALLEDVGRVRVFDPACGSGNFLVIAYKELRRLEHAILDRLAELDPSHYTLFTDSVVNIEHFYGIEIDDFAVEVAILSLWIAKHQMNREFRDKFGTDIPLIPLREVGSIRAGNATRMDWNEVCPNNGRDRIYLVGNPPYVGYSNQTPEQKNDFSCVFGAGKYPKKLDYISLWFVKGADYIRGTQAKLAFVSTNSIVQGEQPGLLFPIILSNHLEIGYAHTSFKWENNAKRNAGVTVVVISLRNVSGEPKYLYDGGRRIQAKNINAYLFDGPNVVMLSRDNPINEKLPPIVFGSKPTDGGNLILKDSDRTEIASEFPSALRLIKRYIGADEFLKGRERFCIWVDADEWEAASAIPPFSRRFDAVKKFRMASTKAATRADASRPYRFSEPRYRPTESIVFPRTSSERRDYIPIGYLGPDTVISDSAFAIYDADLWLFALLTSRMHMAWVNVTAGGLETRIRYSNTIVYNNFPVPELTDFQKEELENRALRVLDVREYFYEKTPAELYDPDTMPVLLSQAHAQLDAAVDRIYRERPFASDEERSVFLLDLYQQMTKAESNAASKTTSRRTRKAR